MQRVHLVMMAVGMYYMPCRT